MTHRQRNRELDKVVSSRSQSYCLDQIIAYSVIPTAKPKLTALMVSRNRMLNSAPGSRKTYNKQIFTQSQLLGFIHLKPGHKFQHQRHTQMIGVRSNIRSECPESYVFYILQKHFFTFMVKIQYSTDSLIDIIEGYRMGQQRHLIMELDIWLQQKLMIRNFAKTFITVIKPATFSTYKVKGSGPIKSQTEDVSKPKVYRKEDALRVFQQFLDENPQNPSEQEQNEAPERKDNYRKQDELSFDPYRVLGLSTGASKDKIDQAYRSLAVKYHPKNNSSLEAAQRFIDISRAYEMLAPMKSTEKKEKSGYSTFMSDINSSVKDYLGFQTKMKSSKAKNQESGHSNAQLYTESKNIKRVGATKQVVIQKQFNSNGKLIKFTQTEDYKEDGTVEVTENYDDGNDVRVHRFMRNADGTEVERKLGEDKKNKDK